MGKIPKEIVDKIEQRNALNKEIETWCNANLDMEGMGSDYAKITDFITGDEQGTDDCKEWCDQWQVYEDSFSGNYYWETEYEGKYLCMEFYV